MSGSGGPPVPPPPPPTSHHPHTRQVPPVPPPLPTNSAWNHLQVPNYYPTTRQPTWHTPTTEPLPQKLLPPVTTHSHIFSLEQMLQERQYQPRHSPGVDLTTRNQQQNGETTTTTTTTTSTTTTTPISLSVRDTNKINSLPVSALEIQPTDVNLKQLSPILINNDHTINNIKKQPPQQLQRSNKRVDSILERLNPNLDKQQDCNDTSDDKSDKNNGRSVIVQPTNSSNDENSNSSSIVLNTTTGQTTTTTTTPTTTDDIVSTFSNEDSLDSNKSRRKRKPSKTIRVQTTKDEDFNKEPQSQPPASQQPELNEEKKITERRRSGDDSCGGDDEVTKRRKTSSESETIDNIAAMVQESLKASPATPTTTTTTTITTVENKAISVSVIKTNETTTTDSLITTTQTKQQNQFVEVENKLEEMFAGIEDDQKQQQSDEIVEKEETPELEELVDLGVDKIDGVHKEQRIGQDRNVTSTSNDLIQTKTKKSLKKTKRKRKNFNSKRENFVNGETLLKRKKINKNGKKQTSTPIKTKKTKLEQIKDVYSYDSASNSSNRSQQQSQQQQQQQQQRGPFIQIKGPRDSPISVNIINAYDDDDNKRLYQQQHRRNHLNNSKRKFFDDNEYRMKIRRKGLHSSTLSQQYDANCKDTTWICVFCKRGPHSTQLNGTTILTNYSNGDLFGPYFITKSTDDEFNHLVNDPYDKQFKSKKIAKILDGCSNQKNNITNGKKAKRKHSIESTSTNSTNTIIATTTTPTINTNNNNNNNISNSHINNNNNNDSDDIYLGMLDTGNNSYEIWAHEDCIIWSPNVYLIGPKIYGLDDSIWTSCNLLCIICNLKGANIHCLKRGCFNIAHVCCAKLNHWQFDDDQFKTYCPEHRVL